MKYYIYLLFILLSIILANQSSAAHFIVGSVNNSIDGTNANGRTIVLWNTATGIIENVTDTIGNSGNSGTDNVYMFDCELLSTPCVVGDILNIKVTIGSGGYLTKNISVTVTGAGFDLVNDLVLNSPPLFLNMTLDDNILVPSGEIDLNPGGTQIVNCRAYIRDYENDNITINSTFFDNTGSSFGSLDDNNRHYTNSSCFINNTFAVNVSYVECNFNITYYANSGIWNCTLQATDFYGANKIRSNTTFINKLLSISVPDLIDYGVVNGLSVSNQTIVNISNFGNTAINISLEGYAISRYDNLSMNCSEGSVKNISVYYEKYNLTGSNNSILTFAQFNSLYVNLTSDPIVRRLGLNYRQNDALNDAINSTYWRIYVPAGVAGSCSGNILFGATLAPGN